MSSGGGIETLRDLLFLRGVDMAIVPANALAQAKATELLGPGLPQRIAYIARLYNEEVHLVVGRNIKALADLSGKKVAVPLEDGRPTSPREICLRASASRSRSSECRPPRRSSRSARAIWQRHS